VNAGYSPIFSNFNSVMILRTAILIPLFYLTIPLFAQVPANDTIPFSDNKVKSSDQYVLKTTVDTAITLVINELLAQNSDFNVDEFGNDDDWFEVYNYGDDPVLLNNLWFTDDPAEPAKWKIDTLENIFLDPGGYFLVWADDEPWQGYEHANFKISGDGEYIGIYTAELQVVDEISFGEQTPNISYGRTSGTGLNWVFLDPPTPEGENANTGGGIVLPAPFSGISGGVFADPQKVHLFAPVAGAEIRYTLDAGNPDSESELYEDPIEISSTTILKARLFREGDLAGPILTSTYFIAEDKYSNPLVSIVATEEDLFGNQGLITTNSGIREISAHFEYMSDGQTFYASGTGLQLHSTTSGKPTSLRFHARSRYGNDWFDYPFFGDQAPFSFKRLILRNSGNDNVNISTTHTHFRDLLIHEIARRSLKDPMISAGKPVNVFLNGKYHGIFNMRERIDQFYIESHTGTTEKYDLLERAFGFPGNKNPIVGSFDEWNNLMSFVDTTGDPSVEEDFSYIASQVNIENFTEYWMTEVFVGNYDWLSNNVKFWKPEDGPWQWIFWDLDHGIGTKKDQYGYVSWNTLEWSLTFNERTWPNGYNNMLIRNLMKNEGYHDHIIKKFATLLNTSFAYSSTKPVYDSLQALYENDMIYHTTMWNKEMDDWRSACDTVDHYLKYRPEAVFNHLQRFFELEEPVDVELNVIPEGAGSIIWGGEKIPTASLDGKYFPGLSYRIGAQAIPGYHLAQWTLNGESADPDTIDLSGPVEINAYFENNNYQVPLQFTELYSNNRQYFDCGDWIELLHYGYDRLDLSGAELRNGDDQTLFIFDEGFQIDPGTYFVIAEDAGSFGEIFPPSVEIAGELLQDFSGDPVIKLVLADGTLACNVSFMHTSSWPVLPDEGYSLELKKPVLDEQVGSNWSLSHNEFGSPGLSNSLFYNFHQPNGKDSILSNEETAMIRFDPPGDLYSDQDGHALAGIHVTGLEGPGKFYFGGDQVTSNSILPPGDLFFEPSPPYSKASRLVYRLIDRSGESSEAFLLNFLPDTDIRKKIRSAFKIYPNPAVDHVTIRFETSLFNSADFVMFDIMGNQILQRKIAGGQNMTTVPLNDLKPGIYIYSIRTAGDRWFGKIEVIR